MKDRRDWLDVAATFKSLSLFQSGPNCGTIERRLNAKFALDCEIADLFPYLNAEIRGAQYFTKPSHIKFIHNKRLCILYPTEGVFTPVRNRDDAFAFLEDLLATLQRISHKRDELIPDHRTCSRISTVEVLKMLPQTNCGRCGFSTCLAFAAALSRQETLQIKCPYLPKPVEEKSSFKVRDKDGGGEKIVSLPIKTDSLYEEIERQEIEIKELQERLTEFELARAGIEENNKRLASPLTKRELEVLLRLAKGKTNKEISTGMGISEHTVKTHVNHIFDKLGINDRTQASVWAVKNGLL